MSFNDSKLYEKWSDSLDNKIGKAIKLEKGCCYVIEYDDYLTKDQRSSLKDALQEISVKFCCEFVVLDGGGKIARER